MGLRNLISQPTRVTEKTLDENGVRYLFKGSPDANVFADSLLLSKDRVELLAKHWSAVCGQFVDPELVKHIKAVHKTLQPKEWDAATEDWNTVNPYDESEIATLACKEGPLFIKMIAAAYEVLGLTEEQQKHFTSFDEVAAGNSETQTGTS